MEKTCHGCHGHSFDYSEANLKRCSGCRKAYYCSSACQKDDWVYHIFDCNPHRPVNTADYLALAVHQDLIPGHPQTRMDYGFNRALTAEESSNLLSLYIGLIKYMDISPETIHSWRVRGVLVDEIKAAFYKVPEGSRGYYFSWFLQNEHIVAQAGQPLPKETLHDNSDAMLVRAWRFTSGSDKDSPAQIKAAIARKPDGEQKCFFLYFLLLSGWYPDPSLETWIDFGFGACASKEEEMQLGAQYLQLINACTFKEFCDAYCGGRVFGLFRSKGVPVKDDEYIRDLVREGWRKSVWYLKQAIAQDDSTGDVSGIHNSVMVDYGFMNCENDSERRQLKRAYKAFFDSHGADPLALHEAAIQGNTYGYISSIVQGHLERKFERLMENPYPLLDL